MDKPQTQAQPQDNTDTSSEVYFPGMSEPTSDTPQDVANAHSQIQSPNMNPNTGDNNWNDWCQAWAENVTGSHQKFSSAATAFQNYQNEGKATFDPSGMKPGNLVYFQPDASNNYFGHVGIIGKNGMFTSATSNGIKDMSIKDWEAQTGQKVSGFVNPKTLPSIKN